jgi:hypothetical protein
MVAATMLVTTIMHRVPFASVAIVVCMCFMPIDHWECWKLMHTVSMEGRRNWRTGKKKKIRIMQHYHRSTVFLEGHHLKREL